MAHRDTEKFQEFTHLFQTWDEYALFADYCVKKFRAAERTPVTNADQLESQSLRREEALVVHTLYNRFSPRVKSNNMPDRYDA